MQVADVRQRLLGQAHALAMAAEVRCELFAYGLHWMNCGSPQTEGLQTMVAGAAPDRSFRSVAFSLVRVALSDRLLEVRLSRLEKVLGLMGDVVVARDDISEVRVLENPMQEVMRAGLKVGLRLPWLYYVCRTIRLDHAWAVKRGVPALSFAVRNHGALEQVTVSTSQARQLAQKLER